jgi:hypothetical protein
MATLLELARPPGRRLLGALRAPTHSLLEHAPLEPLGQPITLPAALRLAPIFARGHARKRYADLRSVSGI